MSATAIRPHSTAAPASEIPGPAGHPLLGMAHALRRDPLGTLREGFAGHGDVVAYPLGPRRLRRQVVAVHHPDDVRRVFADMDAFTRDTASYRTVRELFGANIATTEHEDWRRQKRLLQPLFTRAAAERYAAIIAEEARAVVARLGGEIDALQTTERYALRVLGRTLFADDDGIDAETVAALERLVPLVSRQMPERARQLVRLPLGCPTPRNRRFVATRGALQAMIERLLDRRPDAAAGGDAADLLSQLRDARDPEGEQPLSRREVRDQTMMFLLAGYTTTSSALCSTLQLLGRHPAIQERVAEGGERWARAAVQEGLRLHPPAYVLGRRVGGDGGDLGGYALPPGTDVLVSPWITHRHPGFWRDPERFDPSRFCDADPPQHAWLPFGGGARACIGRHLSLIESQSFVRALLERFRIEALEADMPMDQLSTMRPSRPVRIRCRPR